MECMEASPDTSKLIASSTQLESAWIANFHSLKLFCYFPLLVSKGIYDNWKSCCICSRQLKQMEAKGCGQKESNAIWRGPSESGPWVKPDSRAKTIPYGDGFLQWEG